MLKAWIFDLDDTLYPEREYVRSGFRAVAGWVEERFGLSQAIVAAQLNALFDADFRGDVFQWWLSEQGLPDALLPEMIRIFRDHSPRIELYPDSAPILDELKETCRMGLVTEGRRAGQEAKIKALGLDRWIESIVILGEDDRAEWKPSRAPFDRIAGMLSITGSDAAYVGDNPRKDFRGARAAGLRAVRIRREGGLHAGEEPESAADAPDYEIRSLSELMGLNL